MTAGRDLRGVSVLALVDLGVLRPGTREFQPKESDGRVVACLRRLVGRVDVLGYAGLRDLERALDDQRPDVVFNLTQRDERGDRTRDVHICALLELLGMPYTGATPRGLMLGRDKALSKALAAEAGFRVPRLFTLGPRDDAPREPLLPLVVKPRYGDASEGISQGSLVGTRGALLRRVALLRRQGFADLVCEEYLEGREMIVGVYDYRMVRPREFIVGRRGPGAPRLASERFKYDAAYRRRWGVRTAFPRLRESQARRLAELTHRAALAFEMRDYGRLDVRLTPRGEWAFIEANPNPGLSPPRTSWSGPWNALRYEALIAGIVRSALARGG